MARKKSWWTEEERKRMRWVLPIMAIGFSGHAVWHRPEASVVELVISRMG